MEDLAGTMQLEMGTTPAAGVSTRRPRRVASRPPESLNGESVGEAQEVIGEGASHYARGGRAPLLHHSYGLGSGLLISWNLTGPGRLKNQAQIGSWVNGFCGGQFGAQMLEYPVVDRTA